MSTVHEVLGRLQALTRPDKKAGMARAGIAVEKALGVAVPDLRSMAKTLGKNHALAQQLWDSQVHEARILASMIDEPQQVSEAQLETWVSEFDSWDVTDQCISNLFRKTPYAWSKALEWSQRQEEFVKRAGFVMMATLAVHAKQAADEDFERFFPRIEQEAGDSRNFVKKAVNWALRQIGKRNQTLHQQAITVARRIQRQPSASARWVASDALRELTSEKIQARLNARLK